MNIFVLDNDIQKSVQNHCDKHVVKMPIEGLQVCSTILQDIHGPKDWLYKPTHNNHPIVKWAAQCKQNFLYTLKYAELLLQEYAYRYSKTHASTRVLDSINSNIHLIDVLGDKNLMYHPQCMPEKYHCNSAVEAYRKFYIGEKLSFCKWTKRPVPEWIHEANA